MSNIRFDFPMQGIVDAGAKFAQQTKTTSKVTLDGLCIKFEVDDTKFISDVIKWGWVGIATTHGIRFSVPICTFSGQIVGNSTLHYRLFVSKSIPDDETISAMIKFEKGFVVGCPNVITLLWYRGV